jgi:GT2 family glycosyltransferase
MTGRGWKFGRRVSVLVERLQPLWFAAETSAVPAAPSLEILGRVYSPAYLELALGGSVKLDDLADLSAMAPCLPSPVFDAAHYAKVVGIEFDSTINALAHFCAEGCRQGADPHPMVRLDWLLDQQVLDYRRQSVAQIFKVLVDRVEKQQSTTPYFDPQYYLKMQPDVAQAQMNPHWHFWLSGVHEGRFPNPYLDLAHIDRIFGPFGNAQTALSWFVLNGDPSFVPSSPEFDGVQYMLNHADVRAEKVPPLLHFLSSGRYEGREAFVPVLPTDAPLGPERVSANRIEVEPSVFPLNYERARDEFRRIEKSALEVRRSELGLAPLSAEYTSLSSAEKLAYLHLEGFCVDNPTIAVAVPVYNEVDVTIDLLYSIAVSSSAKNCEVHIFDDKSTEDFSRLAGIAGLYHHRNAINKGFLRNVNSNIKKVRTPFSILINNDVIIERDCFENLILELETDPNVSLVGPKVLYPSGVLQEAGGALGCEASTTMVGLNDSPNAPAYNFDRDVDYLSGVCLAFRTEDLITRRGLFDDRLAPAYCEDVELGLRTRVKGRRARYVHKALIWHHLSLSSNKISPQYKQTLSATNRNTIRDRQTFERVADDHAVKAYCFYLPQYHSVPENDLWWGRGFTEWTNVGRAKALFEDHRQPRVPTDLGYYNLLDPNALRAQASLANRYGIDGFVFYSYYFSGRRILERPLEMLVRNKDIPLDFCVCWANEPWTRTWDGRNRAVLLGQEHDLESSKQFIRAHRDALADPRYIRMNGRPVIAIYRPSLFPEPERHFEVMRREVRRLGLEEPLLLAVDAMERADKMEDPAGLGLDGSIEFPPHNLGFPVDTPPVIPKDFYGKLYSVDGAYEALVRRGAPAWRHFHSAFTGWDNSARRGDRGDIFLGDCPGKFQALLEVQMRKAKALGAAGEKAIFINAWNEWAEGTYLEPDLHHGHAWLEAVRNAKANVNV